MHLAMHSGLAWRGKMSAENLTIQRKVLVSRFKKTRSVMHLLGSKIGVQIIIRYYDPVAGRFLSEDPVLTDVNSGASFNRYVYANNNPYRYIDPDGRQAALALCATGVGCAIGVGLTIATAYAAHRAIEGTPAIVQSVGRDKTRDVPVVVKEKALERKEAYIVRVQAQGTLLKNETSVPLTSSAPISVTAVQSALQGTAVQLTPKEQIAMASTFAAASAWANRVAAGGGIGPIGSTTFNVPGLKGSQARVDIEILKGHNIVP